MTYDPFSAFRDMLCQQARADRLRDGLIGEGVMIPGLNGDIPLVYADYVASGRAMRQVEDFVAEQVLPYYANSHTEASYCGAQMTRLRRAARAEIARATGAGAQDAVIFAGSGATAGLNRLVSLFGVNEATDPVVFIGPYEHHSNILPWRESRARIVEIGEAPEGGPDLDMLARELRANAGSDLLIGAFSAASNVTGIVTDTDAVTRLLKAHGALAVWDYAGGGPYLPIDIGHGTDAPKDAIVVSPHKFPGGPGASGILIVNRCAVRRSCPSWPGGGTVSFVSPWRHDYVDDLSAREEAGTPNVVGDIRAALAFLVKEAVGAETIARREARFNAMALEGWRDNPHLTLLGADHPHRLPIFSFLVRDGDGNPVHQQLFTRMLSDVYGIQARGGCACAGPYAHRLLGIDRTESEALHADLAAGQEMRKPGWVRLNFSYLMDENTVRFIIDSVNDLSRSSGLYVPRYAVDPATARFRAA
ncbi:aminotransferase class V-fold PLP-dependent enzyme [Pukyongiella litopenaei]|uniref:Aminotransferase class V-fold PLP-dependent enzyme n=1 Tax=Pukyongiella litopenaei TaxID=2605946 RepID=A0A2S0MM00_9RHOB|nr:aminotransferase class V-fold PLP-dependent enzyme [Pukyongiella litopenaei]AVO36896.1 aminotransferase class V-fold PLP-dependent enzyme [Pukyongiella litopenaei]